MFVVGQYNNYDLSTYLLPFGTKRYVYTKQKK